MCRGLRVNRHEINAFVWLCRVCNSWGNNRNRVPREKEVRRDLVSVCLFVCSFAIFIFLSFILSYPHTCIVHPEVLGQEILVVDVEIVIRRAGRHWVCRKTASCHTLPSVTIVRNKCKFANAVRKKKYGWG